MCAHSNSANQIFAKYFPLMMKVFSAAFNHPGICQMANNDFFHITSKACPWCLDAPVLKGSSSENFQSCT